MAKRTIQLKDLTAGAQYAVQVRSIGDGDSTITSNWSLTLNITTDEDTQGPGQVQNVDLKAVARGFRATWSAVTLDGDNQPLEDLKDYKVVWAETSSWNGSTYTNQYTEYTELLSASLTYEKNVEELGGVEDITVLVYARDYGNNQSASAGTGTISVTNGAPASFTGLTAARDSTDSAAIAVEWPQPSGAAPDGSDNGDDISYYDVFRDSVKIETIAFAPGTTRYLDPDPRPGEHTYYVEAYDVYGNFIQSNSDTATPIYADVGTDTIAPSPPTGLSLVAGAEVDDRDNPTEGFIDVTFTPPTTDSDAGPYEDNEGFIIRWRVDGSADFFDRTTADTRDDPANDATPITARIEALSVGETYEVSVAAFDTSKNSSTFAVSTVAVAGDTTAPGQPAAPTVSSDTQSILVSHDLTLNGGGTLANDVVDFTVHASQTPGFTANDSNEKIIISVIPGSGAVGTWHIANTEDGVDSGSPSDWYVVVRAVDAAGNVSPQSPEVTAAPDLISSANIKNLTVTDAKIESLAADKLTANSAFIKRLEVQNELEVTTGGRIVSSTWDGTAGGNSSTAGYWLGDTGLVINDGVIEAEAFATIEQNLMPYAYSTFTNFERWYQDNLWTTGDSASNDIAADANWYRYGFQSIEWTSADNDILYFSVNNATYNIDVEPNARYVFSMYVNNKTASPISLELTVKDSDGFTFGGGADPIPANSIERISYDYTASGTATAVEVGVRNANGAAATVSIDGLQFEQVSTGAQGTPGIFSIPGGTRISGNSITTGQIESSTFQTGVSGWQIDILGNVEFQDGLFRGTIEATSGTLENLDISGLLTIASGGELEAVGTSGSPGRVELDTAGLRLYDAAAGGNLIVDLNTDTGTATFSGALSGATGDFTGAITATSGSISGNLTVSGSLTSQDIPLDREIVFEDGTITFQRSNTLFGQIYAAPSRYGERNLAITAGTTTGFIDLSQGVSFVDSPFSDTSMSTVYGLLENILDREGSYINIGKNVLDEFVGTGTEYAFIRYMTGKQDTSGTPKSMSRMEFKLGNNSSESGYYFMGSSVDIDNNLTVDGLLTVRGGASSIATSSGYLRLDSPANVYIDTGSSSDMFIRRGTTTVLHFDNSLSAFRYYPGGGGESVRIGSGGISMRNNSDIAIANGSSLNPSISCLNDTDSGFYRTDSNDMNWTVGNNTRVVTLDGSGNPGFRPGIDSNANLGHPNFRWVTVYADNALNTSDEATKSDIQDSDLGLNFIKELRPIKAKKENSRSDRRHYMLGANQVIEAARAAGADDFGGYADPRYEADKMDEECPYCPGGKFSDEEDAEEECAKWHEEQEELRNAPKMLDYNEFIAPLIKAVQELCDEVDGLQAEIDQLKSNA